MKFRWIDMDKPVKYVGRHNPALRGKTGRVIKGARGPCPQNCLVKFDDKTEAVCPLGVLRNV